MIVVVVMMVGGDDGGGDDGGGDGSGSDGGDGGSGCGTGLGVMIARQNNQATEERGEVGSIPRYVSVYTWSVIGGEGGKRERERKRQRERMKTGKKRRK